MESLAAIADAKLSKLQKAIIKILSERACYKSASSFVSYVNSEYGCPFSTLWDALRQLKRFKLVSFGSRTYSRSFKITRIGYLVANRLSISVDESIRRGIKAFVEVKKENGRD